LLDMGIRPPITAEIMRHFFTADMEASE
jgi:hypothetical protein